MNKTAILIAAAGIGIVVPKLAKADDIGFFRSYGPVQTRTVQTRTVTTFIIPGDPSGRVIYPGSARRMIVVKRAPDAGTPTRQYKSHSTAAVRANRETGNETLSEGKRGADAKSQDRQPDVVQQFADQARRQEANPLPVVINN